MRFLSFIIITFWLGNLQAVVYKNKCMEFILQPYQGDLFARHPVKKMTNEEQEHVIESMFDEGKWYGSISKILNLQRMGNAFEVPGEARGKRAYYTFLYDKVREVLDSGKDIHRDSFDGHGLRVEFEIKEAMTFLRKDIDLYGQESIRTEFEARLLEYLDESAYLLIKPPKDESISSGKRISKRRTRLKKGKEGIIEQLELKEVRSATTKEFEYGGLLIRETGYRNIRDEIVERAHDSLRFDYKSGRVSNIPGTAYVIVSKELINLIEALPRQIFEDFLSVGINSKPLEYAMPEVQISDKSIKDRARKAYERALELAKKPKSLLQPAN